MSSRDGKRNFVEFRVYLSDDAELDEVMKDAEDLKDTIVDTLESYGPMYTQDVTYTFHMSED